MRGTAEYFNSLDASLRKQTELESLRAQIRDASTVELKDREDNERLKKQVHSRRNLRTPHPILTRFASARCRTRNIQQARARLRGAALRVGRRNCAAARFSAQG